MSSEYAVYSAWQRTNEIDSLSPSLHPSENDSIPHPSPLTECRKAAQTTTYPPPLLQDHISLTTVFPGGEREQGRENEG